MNRYRKIALVSVLGLSFPIVAQAQGICIANSDALLVSQDQKGGTFDGKTWATAYPTIKDALKGANTTKPATIWVKQGTYTTKSKESIVSISSSKNGLTIEGGFAGAKDRDCEKRGVTILDGATGPSYHVVEISNSKSIKLADLTIANGGTKSSFRAHETEGGGIRIFNAKDIELTNLKFENNKAQFGGALFVSSGNNISVSKINVISGEVSKAGSILYSDSSSVVITDSEMIARDKEFFSKNTQLTISKTKLTGSPTDTAAFITAVGDNSSTMMTACTLGQSAVTTGKDAVKGSATISAKGEVLGKQAVNPNGNTAPAPDLSEHLLNKNTENTKKIVAPVISNLNETRTDLGNKISNTDNKVVGLDSKVIGLENAISKNFTTAMSTINNFSAALNESSTDLGNRFNNSISAIKDDLDNKIKSVNETFFQALKSFSELIFARIEQTDVAIRLATYKLTACSRPDDRPISSYLLATYQGECYCAPYDMFNEELAASTHLKLSDKRTLTLKGNPTKLEFTGEDQIKEEDLY